MSKNPYEEEIMPIGGQAVIEGVMMRSPERLATAVRKPDGEIVLKIQEYKSIIQRKKWLNIPLIRGAITLIEVMILGIIHLNFSADVAIEAEEAAKEGEKQNKTNEKKSSSMPRAIATVVFALGLGLALFFALPLWMTTHLFNIEKQALAFNLVAGSIRLAFFLVYIIAISFMEDVKRLFMYHGAEHKTVYTFENRKPLVVEEARKFTTLHPRCGTSFLVMVMLVSLLFFAFVDTLTLYFHGTINLWIRLGTHLPLVGLVGGISYEAIRLSARYAGNPLVKLLIAPGLALQRITTREPDDDMLEVAIVALKAARGEDVSDLLEQSRRQKNLSEVENI
jgi:uncharacterized protein YqhQ